LELVHPWGRINNFRLCFACNSARTPDWQQLMAMTRCSARNRSRPVPFTLSLSQMKMACSLPCAYCGIEPSNILHRATRATDEHGRRFRLTTGGTQLIYSGLDRVNPLVGYVPGNVVPCCKFCNFAKSDSTLTEFLARLARFGSQLQEAEILSLAAQLRIPNLA
jgi:hypothetical protein